MGTPHTVVHGTAGKKLLMSALAIDPSVIYHDDPVCGRYGGKPVGNDNEGLSPDQPGNRLLDDRFIF